MYSSLFRKLHDSRVAIKLLIDNPDDASIRNKLEAVPAWTCRHV